jgi:hypothetical protein
MPNRLAATGGEESVLAQHLDRLQHALADGLRAFPGAAALYLFGSRAEGRSDGYSDIDLQLITADPASSRAACASVFAQIQPVALAWDMGTAWGAWAATLLFADASPYHKLDFGVTDSADWDRWRTGEGRGMIKLWEQPPPCTPVPSRRTDAHEPVVGTRAHYVLGQILGATRYVKARKRGQMLTAWRFAAALADAVVVLLNARNLGATAPLRTLTTGEYVTLDQRISAPERERLLSLLNFSTPAAMDRAVYQFVSELVAAAEGDSATEAEMIPRSLTARLQRFIEHELGLRSMQVSGISKDVSFPD